MRRNLIGHRGEPKHWPENSLAGFRAVLAAGAGYVETDVQLTADGVAVLCHDDTLLKMTGLDLPVTATPFATLRSLPAGQPQRFGDRFNGCRIATLAEFAELIAQWPEARAFVEIKLASLEAYGLDRAIESTLAPLAAVRARCILISFEFAALRCAREHSDIPVGWVLPQWSERNRRLAVELAPQYLFVNRKRVPNRSEPLWPGPWRWAVYTANQAAEVERLLAMGFDLVETDDIRRLMHELDRDD